MVGRAGGPDVPDRPGVVAGTENGPCAGAHLSTALWHAGLAALQRFAASSSLLNARSSPLSPTGWPMAGLFLASDVEPTNGT